MWSRVRQIYKSEAQLPTVQRRPDGWRVFFGRRIHGQSHIFFAEFDDDFNVTYESPGPLLSPGPRGCFDDSGVMPSSFMGPFLLYTGWNCSKGQVPYGHGIGLALWREDLRLLERVHSGPILDRSFRVPYLANSAVPHPSGESLFFCNGTGWLGDFPTYGICSVGESLRSETIMEIISDRVSARSRPTFVHDSHLCYSKKQRDTEYEIFCYVDGEETLCLSRSAAGWDSEMVCYPFYCDQHIFYNGNGYGLTGFGLARSD